MRDPEMKWGNPAYKVIPLRALLQFDEFMSRVRARVPEVEAPLLVIHAHLDHTAPFSCSEELVRRVRSRSVRRRSLSRSYHLIGFDVERDLVAAEVNAFLETLPGWSQPRAAKTEVGRGGGADRG